jgi:hypothetical protein
MCMLLNDDTTGVVLQVEEVLRVPICAHPVLTYRLARSQAA